MPSRGDARKAGAAEGTTDEAATGGRGTEILAGLEHVFLREGFRRVTVGELASRLHCSRRTLYDLASSKEELFALVLGRLLGRIERLGEEALESEASSHERIAAFVRPAITEPMAGTAAFFADIASLPATRTLLEEHQESRLKILRDLVAEGVRRRECRDVHAEVAAQAMLAAYRAIIDPAFLMSVDTSLSEALREVEGLFLHGLLHPEF